MQENDSALMYNLWAYCIESSHEELLLEENSMDDEELVLEEHSEDGDYDVCAKKWNFDCSLCKKTTQH